MSAEHNKIIKKKKQLKIMSFQCLTCAFSQLRGYKKAIKFVKAVHFEKIARKSGKLVFLIRNQEDKCEVKKANFLDCSCSVL